jgi:hypothetical protein
LRGEALIAFAIFSGAGFAFLTALQVHRAGLILSSSGGVALLGAALVVLNGPLAWSFHYGSDVALALFLSAWLFTAWLEGAGPEKGDTTRFVTPACLLALTRPEAAVLVLALAVCALWEERRASGRVRIRALWFLPVLLSALLVLALRWMTGSAANTSFSQKLLWANWGGFAAAVISLEYWSDLLRGVLLGFYPPSQRLGFGNGNAPYFAAPFLMVFVFLALLKKSRAMRRAGTFLVCALVTALLVTPSIQIGVHSNRYLLFTLPPLLLLFALGLDEASLWLESGLSVPRLDTFRRFSILSLVFAGLSVGRFALIYADNASSVYRKDEALFEFIRTRLPQSATFLNNGSAIEFRTERRSVNLSGVVSPDFALILPAETEAAAFELLSRPSFGPLPPYFIALDSYVEGSAAWKALVAGPAIFVTSSYTGSELAIYPTRGDLVGRQRALVRAQVEEGLGQVDSINVTDPISERDHRYRWNSAAGTRSLFATLKLDTYAKPGPGEGTEMADGGRVILGFEEMDIATPVPNADLWVVVRTNPEPSARLRHPEGERRVEVRMPTAALRFSTAHGQSDWLRHDLQPGWNEVVYQIPARLLGRPVTRLRIDGRYASYGYWFFQKASATSPASRRSPG